ncbi:hypothetical protein [Nesterenkonia sandarakina]|uniref:Uncharacterized protein n=1 Tax=Nesterenkonia sandarakina TaxID=272918 RepID=A0A7Z0EAK7_9MICC|nr:hypothetical protein [Nesterenkonia sandarakina]NYJ18123.1 hypothetical protein [Nesterenkonia sandarakina]
MESLLFTIGGVVLIIGGIVGSIHYKKVDKIFDGGPFQDAPAEFLLLPLWGVAGIGLSRFFEWGYV